MKKLNICFVGVLLAVNVFCIIILVVHSLSLSRHWPVSFLLLRSGLKCFLQVSFLPRPHPQTSSALGYSFPEFALSLLTLFSYRQKHVEELLTLWVKVYTDFLFCFTRQSHRAANRGGFWPFYWGIWLVFRLSCTHSNNHLR